jgi:hypothetical protein
VSNTANRILEIGARLEDGAVVADLPPVEIRRQVMDQRQIVMLKGVFDPAAATAMRTAVADWGRATPLAEVDDFRGNYHRRRAMVARQQQAPHVFHDYNFNAMATLPDPLQASLRSLFEPLRGLYQALTGTETGFEAPVAGPYVHPQLIHYPSGGGFFARHWHNLAPQQLGFIVSLSQRGRDYRNGGTVFEIDGQLVDLEGRQDIGDICVWRYDYHHWVTQSDLRDKFDWDSDAGRWVATYAYFDPFG